MKPNTTSGLASVPSKRLSLVYISSRQMLGFQSLLYSRACLSESDSQQPGLFTLGKNWLRESIMLSGAGWHGAHF